jgi:acyl carrier protein
MDELLRLVRVKEELLLEARPGANITDNATLSELGYDSIDRIELESRLEVQFNLNSNSNQWLEANDTSLTISNKIKNWKS